MQDVLNTLVEEVVLGHDACTLDKERTRGTLPDGGIRTQIHASDEVQDGFYAVRSSVTTQMSMGNA
ncbi:hypothetical protein COL922a_003209 [Colletotrichum nupharicola]|nr:hypothetical protein COL922a_003209 [Colletotrichum nupharicola]